MEFITAEEARKVYVENHAPYQQDCLDKLIRCAMEQQDSITLYSSETTDEYLERAAPRLFKKIQITRSLMYPSFNGVLEEVKQTLKKAGFKISEGQEQELENDRTVARIKFLRISWY